MFQTADPPQADDRESDRTGDENEGLDSVRVNDCRQSTRDGVDAGGDNQDYSGLPEGPPGDPLKDHTRGIELHGYLREDVSDNRDRGQINGALPIETAFQEFRHGEDIATQVERHEHPAKDQQDEARQPLKMADRQSRRGASARQSDKVLRGNIRYEQGGANEKPSNIAAGQEVVFRAAFLQRKIHADPENDREIYPDDHEIDGCERSVSYRDRRCKQHPCLLGAAVIEPAPAYRLNGTSTICANGPRLSLLKRYCSLSAASLLMKSAVKLATAKSITGLAQAQCPSGAEARFTRRPKLPWNNCFGGPYPQAAGLQTQRIIVRLRAGDSLKSHLLASPYADTFLARRLEGLFDGRPACACAQGPFLGRGAWRICGVGGAQRLRKIHTA